MDKQHLHKKPSNGSLRSPGSAADRNLAILNMDNVSIVQCVETHFNKLRVGCSRGRPSNANIAIYCHRKDAFLDF